jgi:hypothetical protein
MQRLRIRIRKGRDGPNTLVCTRPDGTTTMQHQKTGFFPVHDLAHYAVESVLSEVCGFWRLILGGWELTDFGKPWPRGPLPAEAMVPELIVGRLDLERATGHRIDAAALNAHLSSWFATNLPDAGEPAHVNQAQVDGARELMRELQSRWHALVPGDSIELEFPAVDR